MYMKTLCDNKGTGVSKACLFDLHSREGHAAVRDLPDKQKDSLLSKTAAITCVELTI